VTTSDDQSAPLLAGLVGNTLATEPDRRPSCTPVLKRYLAITNKRPKPFVWTKAADEILESVTRFCRRTSDSHTSKDS